jgi:transposase
VVAATLVRALGVGQRGLKNDLRDARVLSEASCRIDLLSVHIPSVASQEVKAVCVSREALVRMRTLLVNRVRSYVRSRIGGACADHEVLDAQGAEVVCVYVGDEPVLAGPVMVGHRNWSNTSRRI